MRARIYVEGNANHYVPISLVSVITMNKYDQNATHIPTNMAPSKWFDAPSDTSMPTTNTERKKTMT